MTAAPPGAAGGPAAATPPGRRRPPRVGRVLVLLACGALIALLVYGVVAQAPNTSIDDALARGHAPSAPGFSLAVLQTGTLGPALAPAVRPVLADGALSLRELRGRRVVLNFWASWCIPCREEAPLLERTWRATRGQGVLFVGLDMQDLTGDARGFLRQYRIDYLNVRDPGDSVARHYGVSGVPETFFINAVGRIVNHVIGVSTAADLRAGIAATASGRPVGARKAGPQRPTR